MEKLVLLIEYCQGVLERGMRHVNTRRILVGKHEEKRPLWKTIRTQDGNIKMEITEISWDDADWIYVAQDRDNQLAGDFLTG